MPIACAGGHIAALTERGGLLVFGRNDNGQLGVGTRVGNVVPTVLGGQGPVAGDTIDVLVGGLHALALLAGGGGPPAPAEDAGGAPLPFGDEKLVMVSAASNHTVCVTDSGAVWAWGNNQESQLGLGDRAMRLRPARWPAGACGGSMVVMVACGRTYTVALTQAGNVWSCGAVFGRSDVPVQVPALANVRMIAAACLHGMALDADGRVWVWGQNHFEVPDQFDEAPDPQAGGRQPRRLPATAFAGAAVVFVAVGDECLAAVTVQGDLWTWGFGNFGILGLGDELGRGVPALVCAGEASPWEGSRVRTVSCAWAHTLVLTEDGAVWHCGARHISTDRRASEQTADALAPERIAQARFGGALIVHVAATNSVSWAVTEEGVMYVWGIGALCGRDGAEVALRVPTPVAASLAPASRVGRGCGLPRRHVTAFCLGTNARLGAAAPMFRGAHANVLQIIMEQAAALSGLYQHMGEGQLRLLAVRERVC